MSFSFKKGRTVRQRLRPRTWRQLSAFYQEILGLPAGHSRTRPPPAVYKLENMMICLTGAA